MYFKRMFTKDEVKGTRNYLSSQKKYEIIRTVIYFLFLCLYLQRVLSPRTPVTTCLPWWRCSAVCPPARALWK